MTEDEIKVLVQDAELRYERRLEMMYEDMMSDLMGRTGLDEEDIIELMDRR